MQRRSGLTHIIGVCALALILGGACTKKEMDASTSGKGFSGPAKAGATDVAMKKGSSGTGAAGAGRSAGGSGADAGTSGGGAGEGAGSGSGEGSGSFPSLGGAGKGGSGDIVVAKAEPSEATQGQLERMKQEQLATAQANLDDAFFSYDSWRLTEEAKRALQHDAEWLKANPSRTLTIEGYCDERGTVAYNLVLGERRAKAARNYLVELGVEGNRLATVSFGKERPFCTEHDESCYQQNRRAHLVVRVQ